MGFVRPAKRLTFASGSVLVSSVKICHRFCATSQKADLCRVNHLVGRYSKTRIKICDLCQIVDSDEQKELNVGSFVCTPWV